MAPTNIERRACVLTDADVEKIANLSADRTVDLIIRRLTAAADAEETKTLIERGKLVTEIWHKWRIRLLCAIGLVGLEVATRIPVKWEEVIKVGLKFIGE